MNLIKSVSFALTVLLLGSLLTGCNNDETSDSPVVKQGVVFGFKRKVVYATGVNDIGSVKITLSNGSERITLPSSTLEGDENLVKTRAFALAEGEYQLIQYTAYDRKQNWLFDMELDSLNEFTVKAEEVGAFVVPVKSREVLNQSFIRNALMGLCQEVFGSDRSIWPWDPNKYPYPDWEGLEFELDDFDNPIFISGIYFNGLKDGKETPWRQMTALPDGTIAKLATIENIVINDIPGFKHLPNDLPEMPSLYVITCVNTGIEELPANIGSIRALSSLTIVNNQLKEVPASVANLSELRLLHLRGNQIPRMDVSLAKTKMESIDLAYNPLTTISEDVFAANGSMIELILAHTELSSVPSIIAQMSLLRRVDLSGCKFTMIPAPVRANVNIKGLHMDKNPLGTLYAADLSSMTNLETLTLSEAKFSTLPRFILPNLLMLDVTGCGLTSAPDLSGLPELRILNIGNNNFATLPSAYFGANPEMRILSLANSPALTAMPAGDLGLVSKISATEAGFKYLDAANCPALTWTTPASWGCYDATMFPYAPETKQTRRPDIEPGPIYDEYFGRVAVNRQGSSKITFGK